MTGATTDQSLRTISAELESLQNSDTITSQTHKAIDALLPHGNRLETCQPDVNASPNKLKHQKAGNASTSNIADTKSNPDPPPRITNDNLASAIALAAQNPDHPAHPNHPRHAEWAKGLAGKFANAAIFGAGQVAGQDMMQKALS